MTVVVTNDAGRLPDPNPNVYYRISDSTSASPLEADGFTATHDDFRPAPTGRLPNTAWQRQFYLQYSTHEYMTQLDTLLSIVNHVMGGWANHGGIYINPSDWISTSASADWTFWEVVRRLFCLGRDKVYLSTSTIHTSYDRGYRGVRAITQAAGEAIEALGEMRRLNKDQVQAYRFSRASSEVLFFGRIFKKDIRQTTIWNHNASIISVPLNLQNGTDKKQSIGGHRADAPYLEAYFKPRNERQGQHWADWLVFSPGEPFAKASLKIQQRRSELERMRG